MRYFNIGELSAPVIPVNKSGRRNINIYSGYIIKILEAQNLILPVQSHAASLSDTFLLHLFSPLHVLLDLPMTNDICDIR